MKERINLVNRVAQVVKVHHPPLVLAQGLGQGKSKGKGKDPYQVQGQGQNLSETIKEDDY
jgi:hypothetical protein